MCFLRSNVFDWIFDLFAQLAIELRIVVAVELAQVHLKTDFLVTREEVPRLLVPGVAELSPMEGTVDQHQRIEVQIPIAGGGERRLHRDRLTLERRKLFTQLGVLDEHAPHEGRELAGRHVRPGDDGLVDPARAPPFHPFHHRLFVVTHQATLFLARAVRAQHGVSTLHVPRDRETPVRIVAVHARVMAAG